MATIRARRPKQAATVTDANGRVVYQGQMSEDELRSLLKERGEAAALRRIEWLQQHPGWLPCSIAGCSGLVGPNYQRRTPQGEVYGFCPRRQVHANLFPELFRRPQMAMRTVA